MTPLAAARALERLEIAGAPVASLAPLRDLPALAFVVADTNRRRDAFAADLGRSGVVVSNEDYYR
ncbi:MAG: hypothetical protein IPL88_13395 [Rhizobiales bacterium]|nr:hypothetical protein [Hyphomicrobiales bacterium]